MDRNEIALRFAVATAQAQAMTNNGTIVKSEIMPNAFDLADAFMDLAERIDARPVKSEPSAPVAPKSEAAKYEPKVGDVVRFKDSAALWVVDGRVPSNRYFTVGIADAVKGSRGCCDPHELTYVRESTDAEKRIAGLPSPEATRPTHIRWTGSSFPDVVRRVVKWVDGKPVVGLMSTRTNNEAPDEARLSDPIEGEWFAAPAPVEPAKGLDVLAECADALDAVLREIGNINYLTFGTREWARTAVRNAREALAARGGS